MTKAYVGSSEISKMYLGSELVYSSVPAPLPYDAKVDYLEGSGTQYITLPLSVSAGTYMCIEGEVTLIYGGTNGGHIFSAKPTEKQFESKYYNYTSSSRYITLSSTIGNSANNGGWGGTSGVKMTFELSTDGKTINDTFTPLVRNITGAITSLILFGNGSKNYPVRFGWIKITVGTTLVYDLIPVRVGTVGYMYDKVNKQLLGNNGSGNFILGYDINETYDSEVEYIESTGLEYIDTCYMPYGTDIRITGKFHINSYPSSYTQWFAAYTDENTDSYRIIRDNTNDSSVIFSCGNRARNSSSAEISGLNNTYEFEMNNNGITINNIFTATSNKTTGMPNNINIILFGNKTGAKVSAKLYYFQIYKNDILVRDFIPVRKNGEGCLYDRVTGGIFHNGGSGAFIYGNNV